MTTHRFTNTFTSGELSPLILGRKAFKRYNSGCVKLRNSICKAQGPTSNRPGFEYIFNLSSLGLHSNPRIRLIPFVFSETQSYVMIFYYTPSGAARVAFAENGKILLTGSVPYVINLPTGWDIKQFTWAQSADEMYFAQPEMSPRIITRLANTNWAVGTIPFTDEPADWSSATGWPEVVTLHQQRLVFGANKIKRQTVWMSKAGDFFDFGKSSPVLASDSITFTLDSGTQNKIVWMAAGKTLNIGTIGNEWTVSGATRNALTPTNVLAQKQTNMGSEKLKPLEIGVTTIFLERYGRSINEFTYEFTTDSYNTTDLAILSKHITDQHSIVDWTYQQSPSNIIWSVRQDGSLAGTTYQRQHEVIGWHLHNTQGKFEAITTIPGKSKEDELWGVVLRDIGSGPVHYLEKLNEEFLGLDGEHFMFMDSYLYSPGGLGSDFGAIHGLEHLEGATVDIVVSGATHPPQVVLGGSVTLAYSVPAASWYSVGLNYVSEVWPTLSDVTREDGSVVGRKQRILSVDVDFYKTLGGHLGTVDREGQERSEALPYRLPYHETNKKVPLFTGIYHKEFPEGFTRDSNYFIRQTQPLPMTIRSVTDILRNQE